MQNGSGTWHQLKTDSSETCSCQRSMGYCMTRRAPKLYLN
jgi:hypothetical protein